MANISCIERAQTLLRYCLDGRAWPKVLLYELIDECPQEFFRVVVEGLADFFEPRLCDTYAALFSDAIEYVLPELRAEALVARYKRVRRARTCGGTPKHVFVLSRVTLGADIKITSIFLEAAKRRFPEASIHFVGARKAAELFPSVDQVAVDYQRGVSLRERLAPWGEMKARLSIPDSIVIDPDSRLTQLGLLPVCAEENYYFFESRAYGGEGTEDLSALVRRWVAETMGISDEIEQPRASEPRPSGRGHISISLGTGGNASKRIADPFESELLRLVAKKPGIVWIDKGAGGEEAVRVDRAIAGSGIPRDRVLTWEGSFAGFAGLIADSRLYIGYDSAGQHAAAALGVPLLTIFAGFPSLRMFQRWQPAGAGRIEVVRVDNPDPKIVLAQVEKSLDSLLP
ncbi:MAG: hypothetical protein M3Z85_17615 [Acidobacteriota bacterium]|nr:hypothetical protein [Acidobacteriota bacterium]